MLSAYFDWRGGGGGGSGGGGGGGGGDTSASDADGGDGVRPPANGLAHHLVSLFDLGLGSAELARLSSSPELAQLDRLLHDFGEQLAEEQFKSVVWTEHDAVDTCSAAEAAGKAAVGMRAAVEPLAMDAVASFQWDGDAYRVYHLLVPPPARAVQLQLRGRSVIGSSSFAINIFISHRTNQPSFAEHSFQYVYKSRGLSKRAGRFLLSADRVRACCIESAEAAGHTNGSAACGMDRPTSLYIAFKCRSAAVSKLTMQASLK